jgi:hypothetical protein
MSKGVVITLSILSTAGIGYYIYSRIKIHQLNNKVSDLSQVQQTISNIQTDNKPIEATEPSLPLSSPDFSGVPKKTNPYGNYGYNYGSYSY